MKRYADWTGSALGVALACSIAAHAVVIAATGFVSPPAQRIKDKPLTLEVVLVNAKTREAPSRAEALAQANLDRGGNTEENRRIKSPLPVPKTRPEEKASRLAVDAQQPRVRAAASQAEAPRREQRVAEQERQAQELLIAAQSPQRVQSEPVQLAAAVEPEQGKREEAPKAINSAELVARSLEAIRLEAQISKNQEEYNKRPKRKFIGARAREYRFASYVEAWRQKVEKVGNLNYPAAAKEQKLYGQLTLTVAIRADGSVEKVELNRSSGHKVLDEAALRIVELAAPFAEFPAEVRKDTDILEITRTWTFTREDTLSGE